MLGESSHAAPSYSATFLKVRKLSDKVIRHEMRRSTLRVYLNAGIAPRGMLLSLPPAFSGLDQCDLLEWQRVLLEASLKLVEITIKHSEKQVNKFTNSRTAALRSSAPLSTYEETALADFEDKKRHELEAVKLRKLQRDNVPGQINTAGDGSSRGGGVQSAGASVVNLSGVTLSSDEEKLLAMGLNFCPASGCFDEFEILRDLDNFARNMRLREYFLDKPSSTQNSWMRPSGEWTPNARRENCLDLYISVVQGDILREYHAHIGEGGTTSQRQRGML